MSYMSFILFAMYVPATLQLTDINNPYKSRYSEFTIPKSKMNCVKVIFGNVTVLTIAAPA